MGGSLPSTGASKTGLSACSFKLGSGVEVLG